MSNPSLLTRPLSRRHFLSASSALAGLGVLGAALPAGATRALAAGDSSKILTASHFGAFYAHVENGRFTKVEPWEKDPKPNDMIAGVQDIVYSPSRIKYPMVRRAYLENGPAAERDSRGTGDFVRVSWDQALDLVAKEIKRLQQDEGPWSIFAGALGWHSTGRLGQPRNMLHRLMNLAGGAVVHSGTYSTGAITEIMPYVLGSTGANGMQTSYSSIIKNTDLMVFWGSDPIKNQNIDMTIPDHAERPWLEQMQAAGKKTIFIDPVRVEACDLLGGEWIPIRPNTDVALALGICHTLLGENLYDKDFIENYTFGFEPFAEYLKGKGWDKVEKTPEWAAAITDVPADKIRELARRFVAGRTMLANGWATQRQHHGEQFPWALVTLASMIGQIGLPGGGFGFSYHSGAAGEAVANGPRLGAGISEGKRDESKPWPLEKGSMTVPCARLVDMLENPGKSFEHNGKTQVYPDIKMVYWVGGNPFHHHQNRNRMREAWKKVETFIVHDFEWTASARFADIVLPATTTAERDDIDSFGGTSAKAIIGMHKLVEPVFEARSDYAIFTEVAKRLGLEQKFTEGRSEMDVVKDVYEQAVAGAKAKDISMPDFDSFWKKGLIEFEVPAANENRVAYADFRDDPVMNMLPTATGKIEIYSKAIEKYGYDDCHPHASWMEPVEWLGDAEKTKSHPLHVDSNHPLHRLHSQLCGTIVRQNYAIKDREPCWINPQDAKARGIADGDIVRVFNDRGQCLAGAVVTDKVRPGVVQLQEGGWYDPLDVRDPKTLCKYGDVNTLTIDVPTSKLAMATSAQSCLAEVEKFTGTVPEVTAFVAPKAAAE